MTFFNSNLTYFHFKKRVFKNVDFLGCNLKHSVFRGGIFINCVFYNTNLSKSNFLGANFVNCHFINCKFSKVKNFNFKNCNVITSDFSSVNIPKKLESKIFTLNRVPAFKRSYIFTTKRSKGTKINKGIIAILKNDFSNQELFRILSVINDKTNARIKNFITYGQFYEFGLIYLKK
ncbi:MAG: pentapeptide repeat-containing protein [Staphylococcus sp.]|nr:pentapeptide repeat-containing protein [Staphylococcus sp.]MDU6515370.1 pentapeptide repeat-containing protein [Staphylococcus epidermidis]